MAFLLPREPLSLYWFSENSNSPTTIEQSTTSPGAVAASRVATGEAELCRKN